MFPSADSVSEVRISSNANNAEFAYRAGSSNTFYQAIAV